MILVFLTSLFYLDYVFLVLILNLHCLPLNRCLVDTQSLREYRGIMLLLMRTWEHSPWRKGRSGFAGPQQGSGEMAKSCYAGCNLLLVTFDLYSSYFIWCVYMNISSYMHVFRTVRNEIIAQSILSNFNNICKTMKICGQIM